MAIPNEQKDAILFFVKILSLRDFVDEKMTRHKIYTKGVRNYCNLLSKEIEKHIDHLYKKDIKELSDDELAKSNEEERQSLTDQYLDASISADAFFKWGMEMTKMSEENRSKFNDELDQLFKKYGVAE